MIVRDWGLRFRIMITMLLLGIIYLSFLTLLAAIGVRLGFLLTFAAVMLILQYYFSDRIVLWSTGARLVDESEAPELHDIVRNLAQKARLPIPRVAIVDSNIPNAFATGRNSKNAVVAVTTGLLRILDIDELEAVLGHEISHIKNRDMAVLTIASLISTLAFFIMRWAMFMGIFGRREGAGSSIAIFGVSAVVWFVSFLLIRALSRYREFAADLGSAIITAKPRSLISALKKISGRMERVNPNERVRVEGLNAFFTIPAVSGKTLISLFSTHPPLEKRIERLEKLAEEMGW